MVKISYVRLLPHCARGGVWWAHSGIGWGRGGQVGNFGTSCDSSAWTGLYEVPKGLVLKDILKDIHSRLLGSRIDIDTSETSSET